MRISFIACLMACLVLPVGAEPPTPEITPEEAKAIAKEIVQEILDRLQDDPEEAQSPSEGEEFDKCASHANYSNNPDLRAEHFSLRTDHRRPCPKMWKLRGGGALSRGIRFMFVQGYPYGEMFLECKKAVPGRRKIALSFNFKDYWGFQRYYTNNRRPRNKKERVHLQLGFWNKVQAAEEGEGFTLRQTTLDFKWRNRSKPITEYEVIHHVLFVDEEVIDLIRKIYHSEAFSWTDLKIEETNTVLVGETIRPSLDKWFDFCGLSPNGPSSSPSQSSQR